MESESVVFFRVDCKGVDMGVIHSKEPARSKKPANMPPENYVKRSKTPTEVTTPMSKFCLPDPRSASVGIDRTPIVVAELKIKSDETKSDDLPIEKVVLPFLETNIDTVNDDADSEFSVSGDVLKDKKLFELQHRRIGDIKDGVIEVDPKFDPRSPSGSILRTPIQIECDSPSSQCDSIASFASRIDSIHFSDPEEDSDTEDKPELPQEQLDESHNSLKKKLFITPDKKITKKIGLEVRKPFGVISKNTLMCSPSQMLRSKQWRDIKEEREKRGLSLDNENTPPPLPADLTAPASAPGKLRRGPLIQWDNDSTMLI